MSSSLSDETRAACERVVADTPFLSLLGVRLATLDYGRCELAMAIRPEHLQQDGFVHAGVQASLADHACGTAAASCMQPGQRVLSIEFKLNLLKPAKGESLRAVATVIRAGRRVSVVEADVICETDSHAYASAKMLATMAVVEAG